MSEFDEQCSLVNWFRSTYPEHWIFHVPNGGQRTPRQGERLKRAGVSPGVPDLFIPSLGLWVEVKAQKGRLSPRQIEWIEYLRNHGYRAIVCHGCEDGVRQIEEIVGDLGRL